MNLEQALDCLNAIQLLANRGVLCKDDALAATQNLRQRSGDIATADIEGSVAKAELLKALDIAQSVLS